MQKHKILVAACILLPLAALAADHSTVRWTFPQPKPVAVSGFPVTIGPWHGGEDRPMDPEVLKVLPSARSMDRTYVDSTTHQAVQLLLLTGQETGDFHLPTVCFPAQGWTLHNQREFVFNGQHINAMNAEQAGQRVLVWYWWYRNDPFDRIKLPHLPFAREIYRWRLRVSGQNAGTSLFVRVIVPESSRSAQAIQQFVQAIWPHIDQLAATGGARIVRGRLATTGRAR